MAPTQKYVERRGLLTAEQAKAILEPHIPGLHEDFKAAWAWVQAILEQDSERRSTFDLSTQAAMVFNRFVVLTQQRFGSHAKVRVKKSGRMMTVDFGGGLLLRFKKFDNKLRSKNVQTNAQTLIYCQFMLDGIDAATNVTFGYKTDVTGRNIVGVYFTCPVGWSTNKWVIVVDEVDSGGMFLAGPPTEPQGTPAGDLGFSIEPLDKRKPEGQ